MKIFISYSSKNRMLVQGLADDLDALNHEVWFDKELTGGQAWWDAILQSIRDCDLFVFALTPESLDSYPCQLEYTYAHDLGKHILPVLLSDTNVNLLPSVLSKVQFVDYRQANRQSGIALSRAINAAPAPAPLPNPLPAPPETPLSPMAHIRDRIDAPTLPFEEQAALVTQLTGLLAHKETANDARQLLSQLRNRPYLLANTGEQIDSLLSDHRYQDNEFRPDRTRRGVIVIGAALLVLILAVFLGSVLQQRTTTTGQPPTVIQTSVHPGDPLWTFPMESGAVRGVFSSDGRLVLTGCIGGSATLWELESRTTIATVYTAPIVDVALSSDDKQIATVSSDNSARIWDVATGQAVQTLTDQKSNMTSVVFSPDNQRVLIGSLEGTARLWDVQTGQVIQTFSGHSDGVTSVAFSPDGKYALTGSRDTTARSWDIQTGESFTIFDGHTAAVTSVAFSPTGEYILTGSQDKTARLWDSQTGKVVQTFVGSADWVNSVAFSSDGKYVLTGGVDKTARLWNVQTGETLQTFTTDFVYSVTISPDGKYVLTGNVAAARLWPVIAAQ